MKHHPTILVLGSTGMLGRTVYKYLADKYPNTTWGTTRDKVKTTNKQLYFDAYKYAPLFKNIKAEIKKIDYVVNCIGVLRIYKSIEDLIYVNSLFPHRLLSLSTQYNFRIIHISTDAVFSEMSGKVNEEIYPSPSDLYGASKYLGEIHDKNSITFRTSIIGLDPLHHKGLLEWVRLQKNVQIPGFINQSWSGCTSLQFAKLCEELVIHNKFKNYRKLSPIIHFSPLGPVSKYDLIKTYLSLAELPITINRTYGKKITREVFSRFFDFKGMNEYTNDISKSVEELLAFEN